MNTFAIISQDKDVILSRLTTNLFWAIFTLKAMFPIYRPNSTQHRKLFAVCRYRLVRSKTCFQKSIQPHWKLVSSSRKVPASGLIVRGQCPDSCLRFWNAITRKTIGRSIVRLGKDVLSNRISRWDDCARTCSSGAQSKPCYAGQRINGTKTQLSGTTD